MATARMVRERTGRRETGGGCCRCLFSSVSLSSATRTGVRLSGDGGMRWRSEAWRLRAKKASSKSKGGSDNEDEDEEEVLDEDFDVEEEVTLDEDFEGANGEDIDTAGTEYGALALECLRKALEEDGLKGEYDIFSFKVNTARKRVLVSIDKLQDKYGSPTLDELTTIVRAHNTILDSRGFPDDVAIEVASPGATRKLRVPQELARFRDLMMEVSYKDPESAEVVTKTMEITDVTDEDVEWKLADVESNRSGKKGQGMNKKSREWRMRMPLADILSARLFIDI